MSQKDEKFRDVDEMVNGNSKNAKEPSKESNGSKKLSPK